MRSFPDFSSFRRPIAAFLFETGRVGVWLMGAAVIMEYFMPGSVLSSIPLFCLILIVTGLLVGIAPPVFTQKRKRLLQWGWRLFCLVFVTAVFFLLRVLTRDQGLWSWVLSVAGLAVLVAVVASLAYDEEV